MERGRGYGGIEKRVVCRRRIHSVAIKMLQAAAPCKRPNFNARHAVRNGHRSQADAISERRKSNARHTAGNGHRGQADAISERRKSNARHAAGNGHRGQAAATIERTNSNARYAVRDDRVFATDDERVSGSLYDGIAILSGVIFGIIGSDYHRGQAAATRERLPSNARHAVGDGHRGQATATRERKTINARHTIRNNKIRYFLLIQIEMMSARKRIIVI